MNPLLKNLTTGDIIEITDSPFTIGRSLTSNYVIEDKIISRTHCSFNKVNNIWILQDTSTNGVFINENFYNFKTTPTLMHNDKICLGSKSYMYQFLYHPGNVPRDVVDILNDTPVENIVNVNTNSTSLPLMGQSRRDFSNISSNPLKRHLEISNNLSKRLKLSTNTYEIEINHIPSHDTPSTSSQEPNCECVWNNSTEIPLLRLGTTTVVNTDEDCTNTNMEEVNSQYVNTIFQSESLTCKQSHFEEMEDELSCTICTNLFFKPATLTCSHTFCQYCIRTWMKKKSECPICRKRIISLTRTLVLDNIIEKMLEKAPQDLKDQRNRLREERQTLETRYSNQVQRSQEGQNPVQVIEVSDSSDSEDDFTTDYVRIVLNENSLNYTSNNRSFMRCAICGERGRLTGTCRHY